MVGRINVLVTGVGWGVGQSVIKCLNLARDKRADVDYRIIGVDTDPLAPGLYRSDKGYIVPKATEPGYIDRLIEISKREALDIIVPGSDPEVLEIARNRETIEETGARVLASQAETVEMGFDKWKVFQFLKDNGFPTAWTSLPENVDELISRKGFPLVIKPRWGSASKGLFIATNKDELSYGLAHANGEMVIQEYLIPQNWQDDDMCLDRLYRQIDEFSTEVLVSKEGQILGSICNWRKMVKGVPQVAIFDGFSDIRAKCEQVASKMSALGPINFQSRFTKEGLAFFEINVRFSGSTAVRAVAGFNGPDIMIRHIVLDKPVNPGDLEIEHLIEMRYRNEVYIAKEAYESLQERGEITRCAKIFNYF